MGNFNNKINYISINSSRKKDNHHNKDHSIKNKKYDNRYTNQLNQRFYLGRFRYMLINRKGVIIRIKYTNPYEAHCILSKKSDNLNNILMIHRFYSDTFINKNYYRKKDLVHKKGIHQIPIQNN